MDTNDVLIFDFDGTIADTFHFLIEITNRLSNEFGFKAIEANEIAKLKDKSVGEALRYLNIPLVKVPMIAARARKELHKEIANVKPAEGLKDMLRQLKSLGVKMGILTSNSLKNVVEFVKNNELDLFDFVHTTPKIWSKNRSLKTLMRENQLDLLQVIYVGDETRDIIAPQKAGIRNVAVTWGYNSTKALQAHHPDHVIHHPQELLQLLRGREIFPTPHPDE